MEILGAAIGGLSIVLVFLGVVGYVINIYKFARSVAKSQPADTLFIGRIVGIFIPFIGAVVGYF